MDPRAVLFPVGPYEPRVYWTRRAILLLGVVLVIVLFAAYACAGGSAKPAAIHGPASTPQPTTTPTGGSSTAPACAKSQLTVAARTDASTYRTGAFVRLVATIRTTGTSACTVPTAAAAVGWEIVSGSDVVFTTAGCPNAGRAAIRLRPNHPATSALVWDGRRDIGCASTGDVARPGTYQLHATVDGVRSAVAVFHLTG